MKSWIIRSALVTLLLPLPREAFAQTDVGFSVAGILSVQPAAWTSCNVCHREEHS
jgi:hypothetical protein